MSDAERFDGQGLAEGGGASAEEVVEEPGDDIGNRIDTSAGDPPDDIGNRIDEPERVVPDDIGNRAESRRSGSAPQRSRRRRQRRWRRSPIAKAPATEFVLKSDPEDKRKRALEVCTEIVRLCGRQATVTADLVEENGKPKVVVHVSEEGDDAPLFGRNSAALSALNFITNKIVNRFPDDRIRLVVHVDHRTTRTRQGGDGQAGGSQRELTDEEKSVRDMALALARHAVQMNRVLSVAPLRSDLRRIVHVTLEGHPDVVTMSEGEGAFRKLLVVPRSKLPHGAGAPASGEGVSA